MGYRNGRRHDSGRYYAWLGQAQTDLRSAQILMTHGGDWKTVAFHCQQAIEKALKGYLLFKSGRHIDGHNLTYLCRQAIREDEDFAEYLDESALLNHFYIETRYPTDFPIPFDPDRLDEVYIMADTMFRRISQKVREEEAPAKAVDMPLPAE